MHAYPEHWRLDTASGLMPLGRAWSETEPVPLDNLLHELRPFQETLVGLHVRELSGDDVFRRYFSPRPS